MVVRLKVIEKMARMVETATNTKVFEKQETDKIFYYYSIKDIT